LGEGRGGTHQGGAGIIREFGELWEGRSYLAEEVSMIWEAQELVARSKLSSFTRWLRILEGSWKPNITGYIIDIGVDCECFGSNRGHG